MSGGSGSWQPLEGDHPCCHQWDDNTIVAQTPYMIARYDMYPVRPHHTLIIPKRHVVSYINLTHAEILETQFLLEVITRLHGNDNTIAINDGPNAGRTVHHLHIHVIPRTEDDVPHPRGGIRRLFLTPDEDTWTRHH